MRTPRRYLGPGSSNRPIRQASKDACTRLSFRFLPFAACVTPVCLSWRWVAKRSGGSRMPLAQGRPSWSVRPLSSPVRLHGRVVRTGTTNCLPLRIVRPKILRRGGRSLSCYASSSSLWNTTSPYSLVSSPVRSASLSKPSPQRQRKRLNATNASWFSGKTISLSCA